MKTNYAQSGASARVCLLVCVLGAGFVSGLVPAGLLPANLLNMQRDYGLTYEQAGRMVGLCMLLGGGIGGLTGGWVCGKIGAVRTLLISLLVCSSSLGLIGLVASLTAAVVGLSGYFFSVGFMGSSNALAVHMLSDRQRGITLMHAVNAGGKVAGPVLAAMFVYGVWRNSYVAAALLPLVLVLPALGVLRGKYDSVGRTRSGGSGGAAFWIAVSGFALIAGSEIAAALWIPAYGQRVLGMSAERANLLLMVFLAAMVVGRLAASVYSRRLSPRAAIIACGSCAVFAVPAVIASGRGTEFVWFFLFGLAFSATWPSYFAYLSAAYPHRLGVLSGSAVFATQSGFAVCSWVSGWLADKHLALPIVFGAVVMGAFTAAFFALGTKGDTK